METSKCSANQTVKFEPTPDVFYSPNSVATLRGSFGHS